MLLLLFHIGENLYAIETSKVIEIVPMVILRRIQPALGAFNYRGNIVPTIDLGCLIRGEPCQLCYSTRIILVNSASGRVGLIAERVTETLEVSIGESKKAELANSSSYLGELFLTEKGMVQLINWEQLISNALTVSLAEEKDGEWCRTLLKPS